mgnify:CR=1 FL=1
MLGFWTRGEKGKKETHHPHAAWLRIRRVLLPILQQRRPLTLSPRPTRIPRTRPGPIRNRRVDAAKDAPFGDAPAPNADLVKPGRDVVLQRRHDGRVPAGLGGTRASVETRAGRSDGRARGVGAVAVAVAVAVVCDVDRRTAIDRVLSSCLPATLDNAWRVQSLSAFDSTPRGAPHQRNSPAISGASLPSLAERRAGARTTLVLAWMSWRASGASATCLSKRTGSQTYDVQVGLVDDLVTQGQEF